MNPPTKARPEPKSDLHWLPFRFERLSDDEVFVSNVAGEWLLLSDAEFLQLQSLSFDDPELRRKLAARHFLTSGDRSVDRRLLALKLATRMRRMTELTGLHIFVVTLRCEHACEPPLAHRSASSLRQCGEGPDNGLDEPLQPHAKRAPVHCRCSRGRTIKTGRRDWQRSADRAGHHA